MQKNISPKGIIFLRVVTSTPKMFGESPSPAAAAAAEASALQMKPLFILSLWEIEIVSGFR